MSFGTGSVTSQPAERFDIYTQPLGAGALERPPGVRADSPHSSRSSGSHTIATRPTESVGSTDLVIASVGRSRKERNAGSKAKSEEVAGTAATSEEVAGTAATSEVAAGQVQAPTAEEEAAFAEQEEREAAGMAAWGGDTRWKDSAEAWGGGAEAQEGSAEAEDWRHEVQNLISEQLTGGSFYFTPGATANREDDEAERDCGAGGAAETEHDYEVEDAPGAEANVDGPEGEPADTYADIWQQQAVARQYRMSSKGWRQAAQSEMLCHCRATAMGRYLIGGGLW